MKSKITVLNAICFFILLGCLIGCAERMAQYDLMREMEQRISSGRWDISLQDVERPVDAKQRYGESKIISLEDTTVTKWSYEDDLINIVLLPTSTRIGFILKNNSQNSIKIIWDEAVYIDHQEKSSRVIHSGIRYIDRNNPQAPTIVAKGTAVDDIIAPTERIYYRSGKYGGWDINPLFGPASVNTEKDFEEYKQRYVGITFKVLLPLQIENVTNEYIFSFKVNEFIEKAK